jgi:hypothetical protein
VPSNLFARRGFSTPTRTSTAGLLPVANNKQMPVCLPDDPYPRLPARGEELFLLGRAICFFARRGFSTATRTSTAGLLPVANNKQMPVCLPDDPHSRLCEVSHGAMATPTGECPPQGEELLLLGAGYMFLLHPHSPHRLSPPSRAERRGGCK